MNRLRELRESRGLNMKEAAEALGYKYMTYVNYEKEARQLHSEQLQAIAKYYGVSVDYVLGRDREQAPVIDMRIMFKYNALDEHGKRIVSDLLDAEYERCTRHAIGLDDFTMVARSGKKMDEATKADAQKMAEIIFGDKE